MLVHDDAGRPSQPFAHLHHRVGQRKNLLMIERAGGAGGEKRGEMNVGILAVHDVLDDGVERGLAQRVAINAAADVTEGIERAGVGHDDAIPIRQP